MSNVILGYFTVDIPFVVVYIKTKYTYPKGQKNSKAESVITAVCNLRSSGIWIGAHFTPNRVVAKTSVEFGGRNRSARLDESLW